ncbi:MAG: hypothetical protein AAGU05_00220, partial [Anaerolineaceae bacterium]
VKISLSSYLKAGGRPSVCGLILGKTFGANSRGRRVRRQKGKKDPTNCPVLAGQVFTGILLKADRNVFLRNLPVDFLLHALGG